MFKNITKKNKDNNNLTELFYTKTTFTYDYIHNFWINSKINRHLATFLLCIFAGALILIQLKIWGILPDFLAKRTPDNHFHAISLAFGLVLILEIISFIFAIPCSFSKSVGKQFQILALIFLRDAFKQLVYLKEPILINGEVINIIYNMLTNSFGALIIFALLGFYYRIQKHSRFSEEKGTIYRYIAWKKCIALIMLATFIGIGILNLYQEISYQSHSLFFPVFYTSLIFSDIFLVLLSSIYHPSFTSVFRNSGFALSTLLVRLSLAAPDYYNICLAILSILFAIFLCLASNYFSTRPEDRD